MVFTDGWRKKSLCSGYKIPKKVLDSIFKNSKDLYLSSEQALEYGYISEII